MTYQGGEEEEDKEVKEGGGGGEFRRVCWEPSLEGGWNNCRPSKLWNGGNPNFNHQHRLKEASSLGRRSPGGEGGAMADH